MHMGFELTVVSNTPMTPIADAESVAIAFLFQIGYLPRGYDPKTDVESVRQSVPYKLVMNCFLRRPEKLWSIEELQTVLRTSRPTVYRHLNKLKSYDLVEEQSVSTFRCGRCEVFESGDEAHVMEHATSCKGGRTPRVEVHSQSRKGYRVRYGNLAKAWTFVEAHVKVAMENYRKTADHLQDLVNKELAAKGRRAAAAAAVPPRSAPRGNGSAAAGEEPGEEPRLPPFTTATDGAEDGEAGAGVEDEAADAIPLAKVRR